MIVLKERLKASLYVLGFFALMGFLMDLLSFFINWKPIIFFLPTMILGWFFILIASLIKYLFDKRTIPAIDGVH